MSTERTPQSPESPRHRDNNPRDSRTTGDDTETSSLLFYSTYGGSKLDPEVRLLAALMEGGQGQGASGPVMQLVTEALGPKDFSTEPYRHLFTLIVERWRNGEMTDPGSINAALMDQGVSTKPVQALLVEILGVAVPVSRIPELAKQVLIPDLAQISTVFPRHGAEYRSRFLLTPAVAAPPRPPRARRH